MECQFAVINFRISLTCLISYNNVKIKIFAEINFFRKYLPLEYCKNKLLAKLNRFTALLRFYMSHSITKPTKWHVCPAKTRISLGIRPVWSESSLCAQVKDPRFFHADSEDSVQTGQMPSQIRVFAGCIVHFVSFVLLWLTSVLSLLVHRAMYELVCRGRGIKMGLGGGGLRFPTLCALLIFSE